MLSQNDAITTYREKSQNNIEFKTILIFKCGFDGSSNHSMYNINIKENIEEGKMIVVFIYPIKLFVEIDGTILWRNNVPNSP